MRKWKIMVCIVWMWTLFVLCCGTAEAKTKGKQPEEFANVVLFAHFADDENVATAYFSDPENKKEILEIYDGAHGRSFTNYLNTVSYGQFQIKNIFPQAGGDGQGISSYKLPMSRSEAKDDIDVTIIGELVKADLVPRDAMVDYNGDGLIDNLTVILYSDTDSGRTLTSHHAYYPGGNGIGHYTMFTTYSLTGTTK